MTVRRVAAAVMGGIAVALWGVIVRAVFTDWADDDGVWGE